MATVTSPDVAIVNVEQDKGSYVDWPAIIAGAVLASAISFVLFAFGAALGLSLTSPYPREGVSVTTFGIVLALWVLWVLVSSLAAGGYLAGRMRRRHSLNSHETEMRDGAHGLLVWGLSVLVGALLASWTAVGAVNKTADAAGSLASASAQGVMTAISSASDPLGYVTDTLFRGSATAPAPATADTATRNAQQAGRIIARNALTAEFDPNDRTYLIQLVSQATGLPEADATTRVDQAVGQLNKLAADARAAAEKARKFTLLLAFLTAASLAVAAAAAWWAATVGGDHRDQRTEFSGWSMRRAAV
ncbi:MAG: hypothetical protein JNJ53_00080 [Rhizobiales bacterium]|nr:hypothetical protein [Hyphomicrobiales bacterium]